MLRSFNKIISQQKRYQLNWILYKNHLSTQPQVELPSHAEVVIIGGGSAGCHTLYHLTKRGVKAVLLERAKLTAGTTWHTAGCVWRFRPNDVEIQLLSNSTNMLKGLEAESGINPGWIQNGGIFIAHNKTRIDEYKRLSSIGTALEIENYILTSEETQKVFPLLNKDSFVGALYSPTDSVVDPAMLCTALTRMTSKNGGKVIENCPVLDIITESTIKGGQKVIGVSTPFGTIKADAVVNATGVWGKNLVEKHGTFLPLTPMRHAYIVSESIPGVRGMPNIRDHDYSIYFRIQGEAICMGGYENNPILLDKVPNDFTFSLYDLDWSVFDVHVKGAVDICPIFGQHGIKSTVCGPESFTPDHKPLMGPDPNLSGLFHNLGFNAAGIMFGGGCAEQIALWIINGNPDLPMFQFDVRRFTPEQTKNRNWVDERSQESYVKNYVIVFQNDQRLSGRNFLTDPFHEHMINSGAYMEERQGWERPAFFVSGKKLTLAPYDWYGSYGNKLNRDTDYVKLLKQDLSYGLPKQHQMIKEEALACRNNVVLFNLSSSCKMYLEGSQAKEAAHWIFTAQPELDK